MNALPKTPSSRRGPHGGFTLVEVMISIALALVLILGISQIFGVAQRTAGAGNELLASAEGGRGVHQSLTDDFRTMVTGSLMPALVIYSGSVVAWRNHTDQLQDADGNPATSNVAGTLSFTQLNERIHRQDKIGFFSRDNYTRQTSDAPYLTSTLGSNEAFVWLGHLTLPNNNAIKGWNYLKPQLAGGGAWYLPGAVGTGAQPNDNNLYACDWVLGREVILLSEQLPGSVGNKNYFVSGPPANSKDPLSLLASTSVDSIPLAASRYDLAATSIDQYRQYLAAVYAFDLSKKKPWTGYGDLVGFNAGADVRFMGNPFPIKPTATPPPANWMSAAAAQTYPLFVRGCTQFVIEFAGDFCSQDPSTGQITSAKADGRIDFIVDPDTGAHKIRWYGFPRNPSDELDRSLPTPTPRIGVVASVTGKLGTPSQDYQYAVCPLTDTLSRATDYPTLYPAAGGGYLVERSRPVASPNYATSMKAVPPGANGGGSTTPYICAWGPDTITYPQPKMIRITYGVDDPAGHLNTGQTYEYVFTLP